MPGRCRPGAGFDRQVGKVTRMIRFSKQNVPEQTSEKVEANRFDAIRKEAARQHRKAKEETADPPRPAVDKSQEPA